MKNALLLTSLLALCACGGGAGGGGMGFMSNDGFTTPAAVRSANSSVTNMETFSTSADAIVAAVRAAGIDLDDTNAISSNIRMASHRGASAATLASAYDATASTVQKRAMAELKNMYDIATDDDYFNDASNLQLLNAYVLATGNPAASFDENDRAGMRAAITSSSYATMLDGVVEKDGGDYLWRPKTETLEGVKFRLGGEDSYIKFTLNEAGKIISAGKYDRDGGSYSLSEQGEFTRNGNSNSFVSDQKLYVWSYTVPTDANALNELKNALIDGGHVPGADADERSAKATEIATNILGQFYKPVEKMDPDSELALGTIKSSLISKITDRVDRVNSYGAGYDAVFADAVAFYTNKVNALATIPSEEFNTQLNLNSVNAGLKYADLGSAELRIYNANKIKERSFSPYVGGYDSREANIPDGQTVTFKGTAIAGIDSRRTHNGTETKDGMLVRDTNAVLTMGDGTAQLVMNNLVGIDAEHAGQKWNKLTVETTSASAEHGAPKFTVERVDGVPTDFQMARFDNTGKITITFAEGEWDAGEANHVRFVDHQTETIGGTVFNDYAYRYGGMAEFTAYGPSVDNPTEATSRYGFSEEQSWNSNNDHDEVAIYGAFGGKKQ